MPRKTPNKHPDPDPNLCQMFLGSLRSVFARDKKAKTEPDVVKQRSKSETELAKKHRTPNVTKSSECRWDVFASAPKDTQRFTRRTMLNKAQGDTEDLSTAESKIYPDKKPREVVVSYMTCYLDEEVELDSYQQERTCPGEYRSNENRRNRQKTTVTENRYPSEESDTEARMKIKRAKRQRLSEILKQLPFIDLSETSVDEAIELLLRVLQNAKEPEVTREMENILVKMILSSDDAMEGEGVSGSRWKVYERREVKEPPTVCIYRRRQSQDRSETSTASFKETPTSIVKSVVTSRKRLRRRGVPGDRLECIPEVTENLEQVLISTRNLILWTKCLDRGRRNRLQFEQAREKRTVCKQQVKMMKAMQSTNPFELNNPLGLKLSHFESVSKDSCAPGNVWNSVEDEYENDDNVHIEWFGKPRKTSGQCQGQTQHVEATRSKPVKKGISTDGTEKCMWPTSVEATRAKPVKKKISNDGTEKCMWFTKSKENYPAAASRVKDTVISMPLDRFEIKQIQNAIPKLESKQSNRKRGSSTMNHINNSYLDSGNFTTSQECTSKKTSPRKYRMKKSSVTSANLKYIQLTNVKHSMKQKPDIISCETRRKETQRKSRLEATELKVDLKQVLAKDVKRFPTTKQTIQHRISSCDRNKPAAAIHKNQKLKLGRSSSEDLQRNHVYTGRPTLDNTLSRTDKGHSKPKREYLVKPKSVKDRPDRRRSTKDDTISRTDRPRSHSKPNRETIVKPKSVEDHPTRSKPTLDETISRTDRSRGHSKPKRDILIKLESVEDRPERSRPTLDETISRTDRSRSHSKPNRDTIVKPKSVEDHPARSKPTLDETISRTDRSRGHSKPKRDNLIKLESVEDRPERSSPTLDETISRTDRSRGRSKPKKETVVKPKSVEDRPPRSRPTLDETISRTDRSRDQSKLKRETIVKQKSVEDRPVRSRPTLDETISITDRSRGHCIPKRETVVKPKSLEDRPVRSRPTLDETILITDRSRGHSKPTRKTLIKPKSVEDRPVRSRPTLDDTLSRTDQGQSKPIQDIFVKAKPLGDRPARSRPTLDDTLSRIDQGQSKPIQDIFVKAKPLRDRPARSRPTLDDTLSRIDQGHSKPIQDIFVKAKPIRDRPARSGPTLDDTLSRRDQGQSKPIQDIFVKKAAQQRPSTSYQHTIKLTEERTKVDNARKSSHTDGCNKERNQPSPPVRETLLKRRQYLPSNRLADTVQSANPSSHLRKTRLRPAFQVENNNNRLAVTAQKARWNSDTRNTRMRPAIQVESNRRRIADTTQSAGMNTNIRNDRTRPVVPSRELPPATSIRTTHHTMKNQTRDAQSTKVNNNSGNSIAHKEGSNNEKVNKRIILKKKPRYRLVKFLKKVDSVELRQLPPTPSESDTSLSSKRSKQLVQVGLVISTKSVTSRRSGKLEVVTHTVNIDSYTSLNNDSFQRLLKKENAKINKNFQKSNAFYKLPKVNVNNYNNCQNSDTSEKLVQIVHATDDNNSLNSVAIEGLLRTEHLNNDNNSQSDPSERKLETGSANDDNNSLNRVAIEGLLGTENSNNVNNSQNSDSTDRILQIVSAAQNIDSTDRILQIVSAAQNSTSTDRILQIVSAAQNSDSTDRILQIVSAAQNSDSTDRILPIVSAAQNSTSTDRILRIVSAAQNSDSTGRILRIGSAAQNSTSTDRILQIVRNANNVNSSQNSDSSDIILERGSANNDNNSLNCGASGKFLEAENTNNSSNHQNMEPLLWFVENPNSDNSSQNSNTSEKLLKTESTTSDPFTLMNIYSSGSLVHMESASNDTLAETLSDVALPDEQAVAVVGPSVDNILSVASMYPSTESDVTVRTEPCCSTARNRRRKAVAKSVVCVSGCKKDKKYVKMRNPARLHLQHVARQVKRPQGSRSGSGFTTRRRCSPLNVQFLHFTPTIDFLRIKFPDFTRSSGRAIRQFPEEEIKPTQKLRLMTEMGYSQILVEYINEINVCNERFLNKFVQLASKGSCPDMKKKQLSSLCIRQEKSTQRHPESNDPDSHKNNKLVRVNSKSYTYDIGLKSNLPKSNKPANNSERKASILILNRRPSFLASRVQRKRNVSSLMTRQNIYRRHSKVVTCREAAQEETPLLADNGITPLKTPVTEDMALTIRTSHTEISSYSVASQLTPDAEDVRNTDTSSATEHAIERTLDSRHTAIDSDFLLENSEQGHVDTTDEVERIKSLASKIGQLCNKQNGISESRMSCGEGFVPSATEGRTIEDDFSPAVEERETIKGNCGPTAAERRTGGEDCPRPTAAERTTCVKRCRPTSTEKGTVEENCIPAVVERRTDEESCRQTAADTGKALGAVSPGRATREAQENLDNNGPKLNSCEVRGQRNRGPGTKFSTIWSSLSSNIFKSNTKKAKRVKEANTKVKDKMIKSCDTPEGVKADGKVTKTRPNACGEEVGHDAKRKEEQQPVESQGASSVRPSGTSDKSASSISSRERKRAKTKKRR